MKAIVYKDYGAPDVLQISERPAPEPTRDEVLIRVHAASINPIDARLRSGEMKYLLPGGFPRIPGYDIAGIVEETGENATYFKKGQRVVAFLDHVYGGAYAELAVCSTSSMLPIPDELTYEEAAAIPLAGCTALQSLRDFGKLKPGDKVLVNGASGGVGHFAVQIATALGAIVTGVASKTYEDFVLSLGAVDVIDYQNEDFTESGRTWDLIFDAAGKSDFLKAKKVLSEQGEFVSTEPNLRGLIVSMLSWPLSKHSHVMMAKPRASDLETLIQFWSEGKLRATVDQVFPLQEAAAAHSRIEKESFAGKLVLKPSLHQ